MPISYKEIIKSLILTLPIEIDIDTKVEGRPPTMASSEFLTNKEQGDWAELVAYEAINSYSENYKAIRYGRSDSLAAGDVGFETFYKSYQDELNNIGKKPDLLIFKKSDIDENGINLDDDDFISKAIAAIEVRSSSFLSAKYSSYMESRSREAIAECQNLQSIIMSEPLSSLLKIKNPTLHSLLTRATSEDFREIDFRASSWSTSQDLKKLSSLLKQLKEQIKILHKRDYLSITPKIEDLALVNRWIQHYNVKHYYLQVFFDKAYIIPFSEILEISSDSNKEGEIFSIEEDVKNQKKSTIKINVQVGREMIGRIEMPSHHSSMKELDRGRLLFYVKFDGGRGYLDGDVFQREIINGF